MSRPVLVIIGSGWGAYPLTQSVDLKRYDIKVISPIRTLQYTPLLASAACGHFDFRLAEDPIRKQHRTALQYFKASAEHVDLEKRIVTCKPSVDDLSPESADRFHVAYDKIVLAPGCDVATFDTPGVLEHALFLRTTNDARIFQQRLLQVLDAASLPGISDEQQREILHFRVVGGGAIGIEAIAELYDLWHEAMRHLYPHLDGKVTMSIHEVADRLLGSFDESLSEYAMRSLQAKKVNVMTESHIERVEKNAIFTKEDGRLPYGMLLCVWFQHYKTAMRPAISIRLEASADDFDLCIQVKKPEEGMPRILTDRHLCVLRPDRTTIPDTYAIGDAADIEGFSLPTLAEVALQKGEYLTSEFNKSEGKQMEPFEYRPGASVAYLGGGKGVRGGDGKNAFTGEAAWVAWRSGSLGWTRSWRRKMHIAISWAFMWLNGRDIARP